MEQILLKEKIKVPAKPEGPGDDGNGLFSFIYRGEESNEIQEKWGRKNCCVKVFKKVEKIWPKLEDQWWGFSSREKGSKLIEATHIQNIFASYGLAPRVYAIFKVKINRWWYWAQLTDDLGHWEHIDGLQDQMITGSLKEIADKYHITIFNDGRDYNVVGGKYVDFQGFHLPENYKEELKQRLIGVANVGKWGPWMNYHDVPELEIKGGRNNEQRVQQMQLDKIDFKGKTVLDIGCSEGYFSRYASDHGAKRVVGIDLPDVVKPVKELSSYLGYYNTDYLGYNLNTEVPGNEKFDIVFYFSMCQHIGIPVWLKYLPKELLIFEGNGKADDAFTIQKLQESFKTEEKGYTTDLFERPILWCRP